MEVVWPSYLFPQSENEEVLNHGSGLQKHSYCSITIDIVYPFTFQLRQNQKKNEVKKKKKQPLRLTLNK